MSNIHTYVQVQQETNTPGKTFSAKTCIWRQTQLPIDMQLDLNEVSTTIS